MSKDFFGLDLLCNQRKMKNTTIKPQSFNFSPSSSEDNTNNTETFNYDFNYKIDNEIDVDDNREIMEMLTERLKIGKKEYGNGLQVSDPKYNWEEMALEEMLDGLIYSTSSIIRFKRRQKTEQLKKRKEESCARIRKYKKNTRFYRWNQTNDDIIL